MNQQHDKQKEALASHVQLLRDSLERAMRSPNGMWANSQSSTPPKFFQRDVKIAPFSSFLMALHACLRNFPTNTYISYSDAVAKSIRFGNYNGGVQVPYLRQDGYRNRLSNQLITDAQYNALPKEQAASFRPNFQRYLRMVYNIDQTNLRQVNPQAYSAVQHADGPENRRGINSLEKECDDLQDFDDNCLMYEKYLVDMVPTDTERTHYDPDKNVVAIACLNSYPSTDAYLQDGFRALAAATGHPSRLDRNTSSEEALAYEKLLQECISATCMVQIGRTGAISEQNKTLIPKWMEMLKNNPRMLYSLERDVNLANEMFLKAQNCQKMSKHLQPQHHDAKMPIEDMMALKDILAHGGMVCNPANFPSPEAYHQMLEKYRLHFMYDIIEKNHAVLRDNETLMSKGQISRETYLRTKSDMYKELSKWGSSMTECIVSIIPRPWDYYGKRFISNEFERVVLDHNQELLLVHDPEQKIVNVILPGDARQGGVVTTASGEKFPFWLDPLEQLTPEELEGATITKINPDWCDKQKIAESIKEQEGAKLVRFFETEGALGFYPPNDYYIGKEVTAAKVNDKGEAVYYQTYELDRILRDTCAMDFESISVIRDENNLWAMNMQTVTGENLSVYPTQSDLQTFFARCRGENDYSVLTRKELAQKYYNLTLENPDLKVDIFNQIPEGIDPSYVARVYIYKDPKLGVQMMKPTIRGVENVTPRSLNKSQFQKLWIAPDINRYRIALACRMFEDIIPRQVDGSMGGRVDPSKVAPQETYFGVLTQPYPDLIIGKIYSVMNTTETNRNFRKEENQGQRIASTEQQTKTKPQTQSPNMADGKPQTESPNMADGKPQTESPNMADGKPQTESPNMADGKPQTESPNRADGKPQSESLNGVEGKPQTEAPNRAEGKPQTEAPNRAEGKPQTESLNRADGKPQTESLNGVEGKPQTESLNGTDGKPQTKSPNRVDGKPQTESLNGADGKPKAQNGDTSKTDIGRSTQSENKSRNSSDDEAINAAEKPRFVPQEQILAEERAVAERAKTPSGTKVSKSSEPRLFADEESEKKYDVAPDQCSRLELNDSLVTYSSELFDAEAESAPEEYYTHFKGGTGPDRHEILEDHVPTTAPGIWERFPSTRSQTISKEEKKISATVSQNDSASETQSQTKTKTRTKAQTPTTEQVGANSKSKASSNGEEKPTTTGEVKSKSVSEAKPSITAPSKEQTNLESSLTVEPVSQSRSESGSQSNQDSTSTQQQEPMSVKPSNNPLPEPEPQKEKEYAMISNSQPSEGNETDSEKKHDFPYRNSFTETTLSAELLHKYETLRRMHPDSFIMIAEDGWAKALHENAFQAYDIIHDGRPVVFVQHPLSKSKDDTVPVFEIPVEQIDSELTNLMKRNTSLIITDLEQELKFDKEKGFSRGI